MFHVINELLLEVLIVLSMCLLGADKNIFLIVSHCQKGLKGTDVVVKTVKS